MKLGNAAWGLRDLPLAKKLSITRAMGLNYLELSIGGYSTDFLQAGATQAEIAEVKRLYAETGISAEYGCTGNDFTDDTDEESLRHVKSVIQTAAAAGVRCLRIFAGFSSDSIVWGKRFERLCALLKQAADFAAGFGVTLAVETHGGVKRNGNAVVHVASATTRIDLWPTILDSGVKMLYDPANLAAVGNDDPVAFYRRFRESVAVIHLKDFKDVPGGVTPVACGEGRLDWTALMEQLSDFDGVALLEYEITEDVADGLERSMRFVLPYLSR